MPVYEYSCVVCSNEWDVEQSIKDDPITTCPRCKVASAKRLISGGTKFILKGSGWAIDNYASKTSSKE